MYFSGEKSVIEQWCEKNHMPLSQIKNGEELLHEMNLSKYPIERAFNQLDIEQKEELKAFADIEPHEDYINPDLFGDKYCHYNSKGIGKLADGLKKMVDIRKKFPKALLRADFFYIDPHTRGQK